MPELCQRKLSISHEMFHHLYALVGKELNKHAKGLPLRIEPETVVYSSRYRVVWPSEKAKGFPMR